MTVAPSPRVNRPEIQALRAVAVAAVVLYHFWAPLVPGGYVGVDVFFAISGFLITSHLLREVDRTNRIRLGEFWARRARRLLPAALLVLLATTIGVLVWVPRIFWLDFFQQTIASAVYVENWVLARDAVNYLAANAPPSAVQHYWSLSVEEQFYLLWPLLIVAAITLSLRMRRVSRSVAISTLLAGVVFASFVYSIVDTAASPAAAYFVTPTRAWEFGAGGLLAILTMRVRTSSTTSAGPRLRSVVAWTGWIAIAFAVFRYSASTPFPSYTALLPVLGALAVVWAGTPARWWAPNFAIRLPPVQWTGDASYSIYLWHWPLLVIAPYALGHAQLGLGEKLALLALTVVLAWATRRWVENPVRAGRVLTGRRARWTAIAAVASMLIVIVPSVVGSVVVQHSNEQDAALRAHSAASTCFGAASMDPSKNCANAHFPVITPDPALAPQDSPSIYFTNPPCFAGSTAVTSCTFGDPHGSFRVALIGDSHAAQWEPALRRIAEEHGWDLQLYLKTNCAFTDATRSAQYAPCDEWSRNLSAQLARTKPFDLVITSFFAENLGLEIDSGALSEKSAEAGFRAAWAPLIHRGSVIAVIHDTPHMTASTTVCVAVSGASSKCNVPRADATRRLDSEYAAAEGYPGTARVDLTPYLCTRASCLAVIGGVAVHTDPYHLTATYARTMTPYLYSALKPVIGRAH